MFRNNQIFIPQLFSNFIPYYAKKVVLTQIHKKETFFAFNFCIYFFCVFCFISIIAPHFYLSYIFNQTLISVDFASFGLPSLIPFFIAYFMSLFSLLFIVLIFPQIISIILLLVLILFSPPPTTSKVIFLYFFDTPDQNIFKYLCGIQIPYYINRVSQDMAP